MKSSRIAVGVVLFASLFCVACSSATSEATAAAAAIEAATATPSEGSVDASEATLPDPSAAPADDRDEEPVVLALLGWWTREDMRIALSLSDRQNAAFSSQLRNFELSYQLAHTKLRDARRAQARMIEDADTPGAQILAFHREQMQKYSTETLEINIQARLWVREQLSTQQMAVVLQRWPGFFRARWFRPARTEVRQGQVRETPR